MSLCLFALRCLYSWCFCHLFFRRQERGYFIKKGRGLQEWAKSQQIKEFIMSVEVFLLYVIFDSVSGIGLLPAIRRTCERGPKRNHQTIELLRPNSTTIHWIVDMSALSDLLTDIQFPSCPVSSEKAWQWLYCNFPHSSLHLQYELSHEASLNPVSADKRGRRSKWAPEDIVP